MRSKTAGFTLIELLVTMVIAGIAMSLVGGIATNQLDNFETLKQREEMLRVLKEAENKAFILHHPVRVYTESNRMRLTLKGFRKDETFYTATFPNLSFPKASYDINGNGFWVQQNFIWQEGEREKTTGLN